MRPLSPVGPGLALIVVSCVLSALGCGEGSSQWAVHGYRVGDQFEAKGRDLSCEQIDNGWPSWAWVWGEVRSCYAGPGLNVYFEPGGKLVRIEYEPSDVGTVLDARQLWLNVRDTYVAMLGTPDSVSPDGGEFMPGIPRPIGWGSRVHVIWRRSDEQAAKLEVMGRPTEGGWDRLVLTVWRVDEVADNLVGAWADERNLYARAWDRSCSWRNAMPVVENIADIRHRLDSLGYDVEAVDGPAARALRQLDAATTLGEAGFCQKGRQLVDSMDALAFDDFRNQH